MGVIATAFGVAAVSAVAVARIAGPRHDSLKMALMLLAFWAIANAMPSWIDPILDTAGFYAAFYISFERPKCRWCFALLTAFTVQLLIHVAFLFDGASYWRMLALNVVFAVQLLCVCIPGGIVGLRRLRDCWALLHHARTVADPARSEEPEPPPAPARTLKVAGPSRHRR